MKKIPLTRGQEAIVDDHWYEYLMQWKWNAWWNKDTNSFYAVRWSPRPNRVIIRMHRVVARTPKGMRCDHVHHNTLDNREAELRNATPSQSQMNRGLQSNNTSGITGVRKNPHSYGYVASLQIQRKVVFRKTFPTLEEAVTARKKAEEKYFGEFAYEESK